ncbi:SDR family NAD(P)-dependent oxidoreductase [Micromonospora sp. RTGN7]|uniref:SDR family NAD(P)-dependent oxidoreductase n=1 Tax=Micromonospora sp. RTGN7 TaxID=3016526 RepID=UPI0029FF3AF2|nr:SDR family NAD(P)-dependent oxidoreductase [Micromonospora sp. RTGN7]
MTGGNRGLGLRIVKALAARGMRVVMASRSAAGGRAAIDLLGDLADRVAVRQLDITDPASVDRMLLAVRVLLGRCDVLVNNAAVLLEEDSDSVVSVDLDVAHRTLETNVLGTWRMAQAVVPMMRAQRYGRIVNIAGDLGRPGTVGHGLPAYRISKDTVNSLTRMLADELAGDGVLVNSYCPEVVPQDDDPSLFSAPVETPVWLATLPDGGPTGGCYQERAPSRR